MYHLITNHIIKTQHILNTSLQISSVQGLLPHTLSFAPSGAQITCPEGTEEDQN